MKEKNTATILAFFAGTMGLHWFYLEKKETALLYFLLFLVGGYFMVTEGMFWIILIPAGLVFYDLYTLFTMPKDEFDGKYNNPLDSEK